MKRKLLLFSAVFMYSTRANDPVIESKIATCLLCADGDCNKERLETQSEKLKSLDDELDNILQELKRGMITDSESFRDLITKILSSLHSLKYTPDILDQDDMLELSITVFLALRLTIDAEFRSFLGDEDFTSFVEDIITTLPSYGKKLYRYLVAKNPLNQEDIQAITAILEKIIAVGLIERSTVDNGTLIDHFNEALNYLIDLAVYIQHDYKEELIAGQQFESLTNLITIAQKIMHHDKTTKNEKKELVGSLTFEEELEATLQKRRGRVQ